LASRDHKNNNFNLFYGNAAIYLERSTHREITVTNGAAEPIFRLFTSRLSNPWAEVLMLFGLSGQRLNESAFDGFSESSVLSRSLE